MCFSEVFPVTISSQYRFYQVLHICGPVGWNQWQFGNHWMKAVCYGSDSSRTTSIRPMLSSEPHGPSQDSTCWQLCKRYSYLQQVSLGLHEDTHCIKGASSLSSSLLISVFYFCWRSFWWRCDGTSVDRSLSRGSYIWNPIKDVYEAASQREEESETQQIETRRRGSWCTPSRDIPLVLCAAESVPWQLQLIQCQPRLLHTQSERNSGRKHKLLEHTERDGGFIKASADRIWKCLLPTILQCWIQSNYNFTGWN